MRSTPALRILSLAFFLVASVAQSALDFRLAKARAEHPLTAEVLLLPFEVEPQQIAQLQIQLHLPKGYQAYQDQFKLEIMQPAGFKVSSFQISPLISIFDKFSKKDKMVLVEKGTLVAPIEISDQVPSGDQSFRLKIRYQACTETYCLFPEDLIVDVPFKMKGSAFVAEKKNFLSLSFKDAYSQGLIWAFLFVFVFGLLTSLTPCIYPMIPITIAILGREAHARTRWQSFFASWMYVTGIGLTFSTLGVLAATSGALFGSFMSSPWILGFVCLVFLTMALSMFGLFELEAPRFLRDGLFSHLQTHGYLGALVSGMIAGVITSPCVGPVLVGILTFVAQTKNAWLGFWLLFVYALGMGMLFLVLGMSTSMTKLLPKTGIWMNRIKIFFGILLLGAFFYYLDTLLVSSKTIPRSVFSMQINSEQKSNAKPVWIPYSEEVLRQAAKDNKPVIVDFRAEWCAACLEMEEQTFSVAKVIKLSEEFVMIQFDATNDSPELTVLKEKYQIVGLPTLLFFDRKGELRKDLTLTEFEAEKGFTVRMKSALE